MFKMPWPYPWAPSRSVSLECIAPLLRLQFGEEGINEGVGGGGGGGGGMADLFDILSGGMGGRRGSQRERRSEDVVHKLQVSLEDLYNGVTK